MKAELARIEAEEGRTFDEIVVKASPFVRTMATCARICKQINIENVAIDYDYCEWLSEYLYTVNPMPLLSMRNKDAATLNTEFDLLDIAFTDNDEGFNLANTHFVEDKEQGRKRATANINRKMEQTKAQSGKLVADITVSHGFFIDETSRLMGKEYHDRYCDYCAITSIQMKLNEDGVKVDTKLIGFSNSDHVKTTHAL